MSDAAAAAGARAGMPSAGLGGFRPVGTLVGARLRMMANGAFRGSAEQRLVAAITILVGGCVAAVLARVASVFPEGFDASPAAQAPVVAGGLGVLAGFTLVTAVPFALTSLYMARDVAGLHVTPIRPRAIILTRLFDQLGTGALLCCALAGPPAAVYLARIGRLEWLPWCGLVVLGMAALPLAAGAVLTIVAVRVVPARRVRDTAGVVVSLAIVAVTGANLLLRGPAGVTGVPAAFDLARTGGTASSLWLPTGWAARSCIAVLRGDGLAAVGWGLPLVLAGPLALVLLAAGAERVYAVGFRRGQEVGGARRRRRGSAIGVGGAGRRPVWLVVATKDFRLLVRDPAQLAQVVLPLFLFALYVASPTEDGASGRLPGWFGPSLTASFAGLFAASGLSLRSIGSEGRRLGVLRVTPAGPGRVVLGKVAVGSVVSVGAGWLLVLVALARGHLGVAEAPAAGVRVSVALIGLTALAVGVGSIRPRLDWTDPRRSVGLGTSLAFLASGTVYLAFLFAVLALPYASAGALVAPAIADAVAAVVVLGVSGAGIATAAARLRSLEL